MKEREKISTSRRFFSPPCVFLPSLFLLYFHSLFQKKKRKKQKSSWQGKRIYIDLNTKPVSDAVMLTMQKYLKKIFCGVLSQLPSGQACLNAHRNEGPLYLFLVAETRLYILPCRSVGPSVRHIFEFRAVFALLLLPSRPRLECRVSGLVSFAS